MLDIWRPSVLSWSFSRKNHFDSCKRHYFYHRFWGQDIKLRWQLLTMRNITTITMMRGHVVHSVIAGSLNSIRQGLPIDMELVKERITQLMREKYFESAKQMWHMDNRPQGKKLSEITNLIEHFYKFPDIGESAREARNIAWKAVENLMSSELWEEISCSDPSSWVEIDADGYPSFDMDGILIYARVDFAHTAGTPTIIDWKTGSPGGDDRMQLMLYSLYAQRKWDWEPQQTKLMAVYLQPELKVEEFTPTDIELENTKSLVKHSFNDMLSLEPAYGPADISLFPRTGSDFDCRWCRFQGICKAEDADLKD